MILEIISRIGALGTIITIVVMFFFLTIALAWLSYFVSYGWHRAKREVEGVDIITNERA